MIIPSRVCIVLFAGLGLLWVLFGAHPAPLLAIAALGVVCLLDSKTLPQQNDLVVTRKFPQPFVLGKTHEMAVTLVNGSRKQIQGILFDQMSSLLSAGETVSQIELAPEEEAMVKEVITPVSRGNGAFGDVVLRLKGGMGLIEKEYTLPCADSFKVYPDYQLDPAALMSAFNREDDQQKHRFQQHRRCGMIESLRPYIPGEDSSQVDWKASAKRGKWVSRVWEKEIGQHVTLLIDCGWLMGEQVRETATRLDLVLGAIVQMSQAVQKNQDTLSLFAFSNQVERIIPKTQGNQMTAAILEAVYSLQYRPVAADYWKVMGHVMSHLNKRSLIVLFTDVLDQAESAAIRFHMAQAAQKHFVLCVVMSEPVREASDDIYEQGATSFLEQQRTIAIEQMRSTGIHVLEANPETFSAEVMESYLHIREGL